jgi:hypothetical protein
VRGLPRTLSVSTEFADLLGRLEALKTELAKLVSDRDYLLNTVKINLEVKYYTTLGKKQYELVQLSNEILRLRRKIELIQAALNRGEQPVLVDIEKTLNQELDKWIQEMRDLAEKIRRSDIIQQLPVLTPKDTRELKRLYRELVRKLHPDINPHLPENFHYLWGRVLTAYENGDLEELQMLSLLFLEQDPSSTAISTEEQLTADIARLIGKVEELLKELAKIQEQFPFTYQGKLDDEDWIRAEQEAIQKKIDEMQQQKEIYLTILGGSWGGGQFVH